MRLSPAIALHELAEDPVTGFGDQPRRQLRRQERRDRKALRRKRKADRRLQRVQKKRHRLQKQLVPVRAPAPRQALQPAPSRLPLPAPLERVVEEVVDWVDEESPEEEEDAVEEGTEGVGLWASEAQAWGPSVSMGRRLRIQAALGFRAAVIELKPGLFLVAEVPEALMRTEFGLAPLLAPMMMTAARRSMDEPAQRRGPFARMFRRRQLQEPVRYVQVAPLALPGPAEEAVTVVPAPNVGWADDTTVAAAYGCTPCSQRSRS